MTNDVMMKPGSTVRGKVSTLQMKQDVAFGTAIGKEHLFIVQAKLVPDY